MVRRPPSMDLYHAITVAADALAERWAEPGVAALLAWGTPAEIEVVYCRGLEESICRGLSTAAGRTIVDGLRRSGEPVVVRTELLDAGTELREALDHGDLEGLLLVPLFTWEGVGGVVCIEISEGIETLERGIDPELRLSVDRVSRALRSLQLVAAHAALVANVRLDRRNPSAGFDGTVVVDRWERVIFASGLITGLPGWSRQGPFGRPLDGLPGGTMLAGIPLSDESKLKWEEHLMPPLAKHGIPVSIAAVPFAPIRPGEDGGRILLLSDLRAEREKEEGCPPMLGTALRVASALGAVATDLWESSGEVGSPMAERFHRYVAEVARRTGDAEERIAAVIEDDAGQLREPVDLNALVHEIVAPQERALLGEGVRILRFLNPELPRTPVGPIELQHILTGVIDIARDSLRPNGGTLTLRTWEENGEVYVAVSDDGRGVDVPRNQDAFQPLYDHIEEGTRTEAFLKAAKEQVAAWGGRLMLESRPGMWNRVSIMLPADRRAGTTVGDTSFPPAVRVGSDAEGMLHVLVVDDNPSLRSVMRRYLERRGHTVSEAQDGEEALRILDGARFDRIVVDVRMPGTDGPTFFRRLEGVAPDMQRRTIFMTGGFLEESTETFIESTGRPAIQKPFDLADMAREVEA